MSVLPIPQGFRSVTPYLLIRDVAGVISFLKYTFGAVEMERIPGPDGKIMHAEVKIGDSMIMLGEASGTFEPMPSSIYVYVQNTDAAYNRGLEAGGTSVMEPADQFYGDRNCGVKDGSGNIWWIATHVEDVSPEELARRSKAHHPA